MVTVASRKRLFVGRAKTANPSNPRWGAATSRSERSAALSCRSRSCRGGCSPSWPCSPSAWRSSCERSPSRTISACRRRPPRRGGARRGARARRARDGHRRARAPRQAGSGSDEHRARPSSWASAAWSRPSSSPSSERPFWAAPARSWRSPAPFRGAARGRARAQRAGRPAFGAQTARPGVNIAKILGRCALVERMLSVREAAHVRSLWAAHQAVARREEHPTVNNPEGARQ